MNVENHSAIYCPQCGLKHERSLRNTRRPLRGSLTVCIGCDTAMRFPQYEAPMFFERVEDKDVPVRELVDLQRIREQLKRARRRLG